MPCDQAQEVTVEFGEATNLDVLALALEGLGLRAVKREGRVVSFRGGLFRECEFILSGYEAREFPALDVLKRAYTKASVLENADRFAWAAKPKVAQVLAGFSRQW